MNFSILACATLILTSSLSALAAPPEELYERGSSSICNSRSGAMEIKYKDRGVLGFFDRSELQFKDSVVGQYEYSERDFFPKDWSLRLEDLSFSDEIKNSADPGATFMIIFTYDDVTVVRADSKRRNGLKNEYFVIRGDALSHFGNCRSN